MNHGGQTFAGGCGYRPKSNRGAMWSVDKQAAISGGRQGDIGDPDRFKIHKYSQQNI